MRPKIRDCRKCKNWVDPESNLYTFIDCWHYCYVKSCNSEGDCKGYEYKPFWFWRKS